MLNIHISTTLNVTERSSRAESKDDSRVIILEFYEKDIFRKLDNVFDFIRIPFHFFL